ncbi:potassium/sodium hyperpolarization-activated cyclic nucleotide-gated channel 4-like [Ochlerotatus camptorhynchus]|uniref:potassium/sodium hyperpolarization-activated cyclic nucleotide-gated channel 4-like n=1 Tax=Ochlerotatus camptorhynchus TaxID=644619 RepID=UPI0031CE1AFC
MNSPDANDMDDQQEDCVTHEHNCSLRDEPHFLLSRFKSRKSLAFRIRRWFLIDANHPQTRRFYRSSYLYRTELIRHIKSDYWYIIHPFSKFRFFWDCWMLFYIYAILLVIPLTVGFAAALRTGHYIYITSATVNVLASFEVMVNCLTGFSRNKYYRNIHLNPTEIFVNYLKRTFMIDFLFAFPLSLLAKVFIRDSSEKWLLRAFDVANVLLILKLISVRLIWSYLMNIFERYKLNMIYYYVIRLTLVSGLFVHWCICVYKLGVVMVDNPEFGIDPPWDEHVKYLRNMDNGMLARYGKCFTSVLFYLFVLSFGELGIPKTVHGKILASICIVVGICFQTYLFLQFFKLITIMSSSKRKYAEAISQLKAYMAMKQFPREMKNRLMYYYEKKFEKCYFEEDKIIEAFSEPLRNQITDHSAVRFYENVPIFRGIPQHMLLLLARNMEKEIYLPNDMIMKAGTVGIAMYFIYTGSVAVYTQSGKETGHLHDGDHFGEISLFLKNKHLVNVIAIEFTQIFVLRRKVFAEFIRPEHELYQRLETVAKERMQQTLLEEEQHKSHLLMVDGGGNE